MNEERSVGVRYWVRAVPVVGCVVHPRAANQGAKCRHLTVFSIPVIFESVIAFIASLMLYGWRATDGSPGVRVREGW